MSEGVEGGYCLQWVFSLALKVSLQRVLFGKGRESGLEILKNHQACVESATESNKAFVSVEGGMVAEKVPKINEHIFTRLD